ncbi:MAG: hypothetical protein RL021_1475, partial [Bacteroidota bacterium]
MTMNLRISILCLLHSISPDIPYSKASSTDLKLLDKVNSPLLPQDGLRKNVSNTI